MASSIWSCNLWVIIDQGSFYDKVKWSSWWHQPIKFTCKCGIPSESLNLILCQEVEKMEAPSFFHEKFGHYKWNEKLQFAYLQMFQIFNLGCQNISSEILLTLSKFHQKIPNRFGDFKKFRGGRVGVYTPQSLPATLQKKG